MSESNAGDRSDVWEVGNWVSGEIHKKDGRNHSLSILSNPIYVVRHVYDVAYLQVFSTLKTNRYINEEKTTLHSYEVVLQHQRISVLSK